jgi:hypothetical protein
VVKTPTRDKHGKSLEGKLSAEGNGVSESELPPPLGEPCVVQLLRPAVIPIRVTRGSAEARLPIFLDNPHLDEEAQRQVYVALMQIPWLAPQISSAIAKHGLGRSVEQDERATAKLQAMIFRDAIERYQATFKKAGVRKYAEAAFEGLSALADSSVDALKKYLQRHPRT